MDEPKRLSESTSEQPEPNAARHERNPAPEPTSTEGGAEGTLEERLLSRKGSAQYQADVRELIRDRDEWREAAEQLGAELGERRRLPAATEQLSVGTIWSRHDDRDG